MQRNPKARKNSPLKKIIFESCILILLVIWEIAVKFFELPSYLLPPPSEIGQVMVEPDIRLDNQRLTLGKVMLIDKDEKEVKRDKEKGK